MGRNLRKKKTVKAQNTHCHKALYTVEGIGERGQVGTPDFHRKMEHMTQEKEGEGEKLVNMKVVLQI